MNKEFLQKLGIKDEDPNVVYARLNEIEIELLDKRDLAETNGAIERVKEIDSLLEQLKEEREKVKEEAKSYIPKKVETPKLKETKNDKDELQKEVQPEKKVQVEKEVQPEKEVDLQELVQPKKKVQPEKEVDLQEMVQPQKKVQPEKEVDLQELVKPQKEVKSQEQVEGKKAYPKMFVLGKLLFLIGTIYLFKGLHPAFFKDVIPMLDVCFPSVPESLIIKWDGLLAMTEPYMTHQGVFGGWLIIFGCIISGYAIGKDIYKRENSNCRLFGKLVNGLIIFICIANIFVNIGETSSIFGNGSYMQFVSMIGCILIGKIIGKFVYNLKK